MEKSTFTLKPLLQDAAFYAKFLAYRTLEDARSLLSKEDSA